MRNCPLTVNQAGTYNIVGCAPTTGKLVSRVTLQKSMVELRTYAQRQVVREELLNAPMRGGVRYYKGTLQSLLAKWKVAEPAAKGGAAVGAVVQQQVGGAVGQQQTQYQQQSGYPAGKGMGKGKGQMQQPGYTGGQGMGNGKGMQPIPPQANDRSVNWGGQQGKRDRRRWLVVYRLARGGSTVEPLLRHHLGGRRCKRKWRDHRKMELMASSGGKDSKGGRQEPMHRCRSGRGALGVNRDSRYGGALMGYQMRLKWIWEMVWIHPASLGV